MSDQRIAIAMLAGLGVLSTFMPWVELPVVGYKLGTEYSGWITFALFSIVFVVSFIGDRSKPLKGGKLYAVIAAAILAAGIGIWEIFDMESNIFANVTYGLYLMVISGTVIPLAAFIIGNNRSVSSETGEEDNTIVVKKAGAPD